MTLIKRSLIISMLLVGNLASAQLQGEDPNAHQFQGGGAEATGQPGAMSWNAKGCPDCESNRASAKIKDQTAKPAPAGSVNTQGATGTD